MGIMIGLSFQDESGQPLGDFEMMADVPIELGLPDILHHLRLDPQEKWRLLWVNNNFQELDLESSLDQLGLTDGSVIRIQSAVNKIGRYEIQEQLGEGGMGVVYKAYDPNLDKIVAIKVIHPDKANDGVLLQRFAREARAVAKLSGHVNIINVYDFSFDGKGHEAPYIVMEYVDGYSLKDLIQDRQALSLTDTTKVLSGVADALDAAHQRGIIHRDLKPGNVLIATDEFGEWVPKLGDFGLVKNQNAPDGLTKTQVIVGSPHYISPEQAVPGTPLTNRSDIYSLGVLVYEMLTGQVPFSSGTSTQIMVAHVSSMPQPPAFFRQDLPEEVSDVVMKALSKNPEERYASAGEFTQVFREALEGKPPERSPFPWKWVGVTLGVLALMALGAWFFFLRPTPVNALVRQAADALTAQDYAQAESLCDEILTRQGGLDPGVTCLTDVAEEHYAAGNYDDAVQLYEEMLAQYTPEDEGATIGAVSALFGRAQNALESGDCAAAEEDLARALELDVDNPAVNMGMAEALYRQQKYEEAIPYYKKVLESGSESEYRVQARTHLAWAYYYSEQYEDAIPEFQVLRYENELDAYKGLGLSYFTLGWYEDAAGAVEQWKDRKQAEPDPYLYLGMIYSELGDAEKTASAFERFAQLAGDDPMAYLRAGRALFEVERYSDAAEAFSESLQLERSAEAHQGLAESLYQQGDYQAALTALEAWVTADSENAGAYAALGDLQFLIERYEESAQSFDSAIKIKESNDYYKDAWRAYDAAGLHSEARKMAELWITFDDDLPASYVSRAWSLYKLERYDDAASAFEETLALEVSASAYSGLGHSLYKSGNYEASLQPYQEWISLDSENAKAYGSLGWSFLNLERYDDAAEAFSHALELSETKGYYSALWMSYDRNGDHEHALEAAQRWVDFAPNEALAHNSMGWSYLRLKDCDNALLSFDQALKLDSQLQSAETGKEQCQ
jgi:tetratricopeptide (TPR) repeat protein/predicted Ser/Thr protein kinase